MSVGANIKRIRMEKGLTQKQLGDLCGMADSAIRRYESDKVNPKRETIKKIANALQVSYYDLDSEELPLLSIMQAKNLSDEMIAKRQRLIETLAGKGGLKLDTDYTKINELYDQLNDAGQDKVVEYAKDLTKIPEYQKEY